MSFTNIPLEEKLGALDELRKVKEQFAARGWFPGTSGNLSIRVGEFSTDTFHFAVTSSGKDKSVHTPEDFLFVDQQGRPCEATSLKPSAETLIHAEIYRLTGCGAIFHVHTIYNNIISEGYGDKGAIPAQGIELIKGLGIWEENARIEIPVVPNYAEIPRIAELIPAALNPDIPGIVLRNHGIYAWGANAFEAKRHLESFEFIFEHIYRSLALRQ
ncbi:methylthioribulose 1-phosphate dehydratase [Paenibacillus sp. YPG26]|uniref:methylthioribulose 1-phosphate dehydratase n=1 Tax=Paenibacillus sp. YPG26 TaxID=2878915 RepID=UPI0020420663|nr:methylthioribulose 1-phosphate dehydratase [Paenibacillus sp. YPG26]USB34815.1 methylthioribulose 1-phosphate dehydratase [Paenibacillus sp. YPG26]